MRHRHRGIAARLRVIVPASLLALAVAARPGLGDPRCQPRSSVRP